MEFKRKLTAILIADVAGYSRLMREKVEFEYSGILKEMVNEPLQELK